MTRDEFLQWKHQDSNLEEVRVRVLSTCDNKADHLVILGDIRPVAKIGDEFTILIEK